MKVFESSIIGIKQELLPKLFLKPIGGLCNRMRSIDSALILCRKYDYELVIIWVLDHALNCRFYDLFEPLKNDVQNPVVVDLPIGFPQRYSKKYKKFAGSASRLDFLRPLLLLHQPNFSSQDISWSLKALQDIPEERILFNDYFAKIYDSVANKTDKEIHELDNHLINNIQEHLKHLMKRSDDIFIESCYRLTDNEKRYTSFKPTDTLHKKISLNKLALKNSIGIHIRQTDHEVAISKSPVEKFIDVIRNETLTNPNSKFYLSTDNIGVINLLNETFGDKVAYQRVESYDRNTPVAIQNALIDLYCLSNTKCIYGSQQSTFNQTAADIGNISLYTI